MLFKTNKDTKVNHQSFHYTIHDDGIDLKTETKEIYKQIKTGETISPQYIYLRECSAEGYAEEIFNGFFISAENAVRLDDDGRSMLMLPPRFTGTIYVEFRGLSTKPEGFSCSINFALSSGEHISAYKCRGGVLSFSSTETFLLDELLFKAITEIKIFVSEKQAEAVTEYRVLHLIHALQELKNIGAPLQLGHFDNDKLNITEPSKVMVSVEENTDGSLQLTPQFNGVKAPPSDINERIGQFSAETDQITLRIKGEIVLLGTNEKLAAKEVLKNRRIPKEKAHDFIQNPGAFIDPSLVNLDVGFSIRAHGATEYRHLYFGSDQAETENWFGNPKELPTDTHENESSKSPDKHKKETDDDLISPAMLEEIIQTIDEVQEFEGIFHNAVETGATETTYGESKIDISDTNAVENEIQCLKCKYGPLVVVDIDSNSEALEYEEHRPEHFSAVHETSVSFPDSIYSRQPLSHQTEAISWFVGLYNYSIKGAILADDMGLGKTFSALASMEQIFRLHPDDERPVLVVAPLSLLENWRDEVKKSFTKMPFHDIVILNGDELKRFKCESAGRETHIQKMGESGTIDITQLRYTLKLRETGIPDEQCLNAKSAPRRLVITTYDGLRSYQFSLCLINWAVVLFDEAQNLKNPNAIQSIAAKGLKAGIKIAATGTPVENSLIDIWNLMDTVIPGHLGSHKQFNEYFIRRYRKAQTTEDQVKIGKELRSKIGKYMLRRLKDNLPTGLPSKIIHSGLPGKSGYMPILHGVMKGTQLKYYDTALAQYHGTENKQDIALATLMKLRSISLHPSLATGSVFVINREESVKINSLVSVLSEIKNRNEKVIVFAISKQLQRALSAYLQQSFSLHEPPSVINGDTSTNRNSEKSRLSQIKSFELKQGFNVIIMSPVAAGVGLTIIGANNVIHLERHWNPAKEAQATDRVYRIGQTKTVNVYYPIAHHPDEKYISFDVLIHNLLTRKIQLQDAVVTEDDIPPMGALSEKGSAVHKVAPNDIINYTGLSLEYLAAEWCRYKYPDAIIQLTTKSGDHGIDILCRVSTTECIVVQCKSTINSELATNDGVDDLDRAVTYCDKVLKLVCKDAILFTNAPKLNSRVTKEAKKRMYVIADFNIIKDWVVNQNVLVMKVCQWETCSRVAI